MKYKVLFMEDKTPKSDEFRISTKQDSQAVAKSIGDLYERNLGVEVVAVVRIEEIDVEVL